MAPRAAASTLEPPRPFDLLVVARSHGWFDLPPFALDAARRVLVVRAALDPDGRRVASVGIRQRSPDAPLELRARGATRAEATALARACLRLDEELGPLHARLARSPEHAWAARLGAGRLLRAPTLFEDAARMICTTNCSWAATQGMVTRLCEAFGAVAPDGARAFPTAAAVARQEPAELARRARAGYRAPFLHALARRVAEGELDLEALRDPALPTERVREALRSIAGVGPYAEAGLLRLCGRYRELGLDSWCRARYRALHPRARDVDGAAARRVRRWGDHAGLVLWLELTRHWHADQAGPWP